jgi:hypothetical protein
MAQMTADSASEPDVAQMAKMLDDMALRLLDTGHFNGAQIIKNARYLLTLPSCPQVAYETMAKMPSKPVVQLIASDPRVPSEYRQKAKRRLDKWSASVEDRIQEIKSTDDVQVVLKGLGDRSYRVRSAAYMHAALNSEDYVPAMFVAVPHSSPKQGAADQHIDDLVYEFRRQVIPGKQSWIYGRDDFLTALGYAARGPMSDAARQHVWEICVGKKDREEVFAEDYPLQPEQATYLYKRGHVEALLKNPTTPEHLKAAAAFSIE